MVTVRFDKQLEKTQLNRHNYLLILFVSYSGASNHVYAL